MYFIPWIIFIILLLNKQRRISIMPPIMPPTLITINLTHTGTGVFFTGFLQTISVGDSITWNICNSVKFQVYLVQSAGSIFNITVGSLNHIHTFDAAGEFDYHCRFHHGRGMIGKITVVSSLLEPIQQTRAITV